MPCKDRYDMEVFRIPIVLIIFMTAKVYDARQQKCRGFAGAKHFTGKSERIGENFSIDIASDQGERNLFQKEVLIRRREIRFWISDRI